jgi:hypothetical protein
MCLVESGEDGAMGHSTWETVSPRLVINCPPLMKAKVQYKRLLGPYLELCESESFPLILLLYNPFLYTPQSKKKSTVTALTMVIDFAPIQIISL